MANNRRFFGLLCAHQWDVKAQSDIVSARTGSTVGVIYLLRCKHCGDVRGRQVRA